MPDRTPENLALAEAQAQTMSKTGFPCTADEILAAVQLSNQVETNITFGPEMKTKVTSQLCSGRDPVSIAACILLVRMVAKIDTVTTPDAKIAAVAEFITPAIAALTQSAAKKLGKRAPS